MKLGRSSSPAKSGETTARGREWVVAVSCGGEGAPGACFYRGVGGRKEEIVRAGVTAAMARPLAIRQSRAREKGKRTGAEAA